MHLLDQFNKGAFRLLIRNWTLFDLRECRKDYVECLSGCTDIIGFVASQFRGAIAAIDEEIASRPKG